LADLPGYRLLSSATLSILNMKMGSVSISEFLHRINEFKAEVNDPPDPPASEEAIVEAVATIEKEFRVPVPIYLIEFYQRCDGFYVSHVDFLPTRTREVQYLGTGSTLDSVIEDNRHHYYSAKLQRLVVARSEEVYFCLSQDGHLTLRSITSEEVEEKFDSFGEMLWYMLYLLEIAPSSDS
jgi:hypothetical protein